METKIKSKIENIRVAVRARPLNNKEKQSNLETITLIDELDNTVTLFKPNTMKTQHKSFKFDYVFPEDCSQIDVYQKVALPIVEQIFQGYNGTIFAYGQTGSGKTFTMTGNQEETELKGIIPNTFSHIFSRIARAGGEKSFVVTATYLEIYNEEIHDLLSGNPSKKLDLREQIATGVYVKDLTGFTVDSIESINRLMKIGNRNRATRSTLMNNLSSRSHAIFTITIEAKDQKTNKITIAKLNLVDLAGSERLNRTRATGDGLKEATNINQSLFVLTNVISALTEESITHIPYRNSKLTRLLQDSLGGNSKTAMIATITASAMDHDESLCTLRYANRTKLIKNRVQLNVQTNKGLIEHFENEIMDLQKRLKMILMREDDVIKKQKRQEQDRALTVIGKIKNELNQKLKEMQNKILVGGKNLLEKAQKQQFLLDTSFEEIQQLDRSHQELEELLEEKEMERFDLEEQYTSLHEEDRALDEKLTRLESVLKKTREKLVDDAQEHQQELVLLAENYTQLKGELKLTNYMLKTAVPNQQLMQITSNVLWNSEMGDFQVNGIQHVGNNLGKRRFKKHIPKSSLMEGTLNKRKISVPMQKFDSVQSAMTNSYQNYSIKSYEYEE